MRHIVAGKSGTGCHHFEMSDAHSDIVTVPMHVVMRCGLAYIGVALGPPINFQV